MHPDDRQHPDDRHLLAMWWHSQVYNDVWPALSTEIIQLDGRPCFMDSISASSTMYPPKDFILGLPQYATKMWSYIHIQNVCNSSNAQEATLLHQALQALSLRPCMVAHLPTTLEQIEHFGGP